MQRGAHTHARTHAHTHTQIRACAHSAATCKTKGIAHTCKHHALCVLMCGSFHMCVCVSCVCPCSGFGRALLTLYNAIFGVYDLDVNLYDGGWKQLAIIFWCSFLFFCNVRHTHTHTHTHTHSLHVFGLLLLHAVCGIGGLCVCVCVCVCVRPQVVLLNMLIALMRDIYQEVRDREQDVFLKGRAELIVEVRGMCDTHTHAHTHTHTHTHTKKSRCMHGLCRSICIVLHAGPCVLHCSCTRVMSVVL